MTLRLTRTEAGTLIHSPRGYDFRLALRALGREATLRGRMLDLARVGPGDRVLDVGCGTGTLAIAAKRRVGPNGRVDGVDPSPEMVARAGAKARRAGVDVSFHEAIAQTLPFADATFDAVLCTLVLHQLPHDGIHAAASELKRVLAPDGRLLVVDIDSHDHRNPRHTPHARGSFDGRRIAPLLERSGVEVVGSGEVPFRLRRFEQLLYVVAVA
jgi:ubiquinone/menaquinone biosynthesis C-methylase UbiE